MDFAYSEDEIAVRDLAHRIMSDNTSHERLRELDLAKTWFDMSLWRLLSEAGLTALSLPEAIGGGGLISGIASAEVSGRCPYVVV